MTEPILDDDQRSAVESDASAIVVVAGAGCGKTEVVARRIERLLRESVDEPYRVLTVSYTVRTADELRNRLDATLGDLHRRVDTDTVHGFAWSLLRQYGTRIGLPLEPEVLTRDEDRVELLQSWLTQSGHGPLEAPQAVLASLDLARARMTAAPLLEEWRAALAAAGAVDYPAMLDRAFELLSGLWLNRHLRSLYGHVVVDEAQNLTEAQYQLLTQIIGDASADHVHAAVVGDARQSIVGFAGTDPLLINRFQDEYHAKRIELRTNYRSARVIVQAGRAVSEALGELTEPGGVVSFAAEGSIELRTFPVERDEANFVADWVLQILRRGVSPSAVGLEESVGTQPEQIAVLARAASSLLQVRDALTKRGVASATASAADDWVASPAAKALVEIVAYRSARDHGSTKRHLAQICAGQEVTWTDLGELLRSASDSDVVKLVSIERCRDPAEVIAAAADLVMDDLDWASDWQQLTNAWQTFVDQTDAADRTFGNFRQHVVRCQRGDAQDPGVRLLTVHKSQGLEFRAVAVIACNNGQFPDFRAKSDEQRAAELRTFYVAISRPSRSLLLTRSAERLTRFGPRPTSPSPFLSLVVPAIRL